MYATADSLPPGVRVMVEQGKVARVEVVEGSVQTSKGARIRFTGNKRTVIDGPFAETKEQLAGFYLIEARDLNEAIQVAAKIPPARVGSIEVRPVRELKVE